MKYILHGENQVLSRVKLQELIAGQKNILYFDRKSSYEDIYSVLESKSLFGSESFFVFENILSRPAGKEKEKILSFLKTKSQLQIVLWEGKKIDGRSLTSFKDFQIKEFSLPWSIYKFLDSLNPKNTKQSLVLFHEACKKSAPELVFFMLSKHMADLIMAADMGQIGLESKAPWQKAKLISQAKMFGVEKLTASYKKLLEIEYNLKTGQSPLPLSFSLDLWIANF